MEEQFYIYKKEVDWSVLQEGFSIPVSIQVVFKDRIKNYLRRGEKRDINALLNGATYKVKFINQSFNEQKYPGHADILQVRYTPQNPFAIRLREIFKSSLEYLKRRRTTEKQVMHVPDESREYLVMYTTPVEDAFYFDHITSSESAQIKDSISGISEEDFEFQTNYKKFDESARIETKEQVVKIRRLDRSIGESLKLFYNHKCQVCGNNFADKYKCLIAEAHHIDYFVSSLNNDAGNLLVLCPNHHRIIHKTNPLFRREKITFVYPNGLEESLSLNRHL